MKKFAVILAFTLICLCVPNSATAQEIADVAGKWEMTNETPRGTQTSTFTFEQEGNVLSGSMETPRGTAEINSGSIDGNEITFTITRSMGNRNRTMELTYAGILDGDTITGSVSTPRGEREFTMKRVDESHQSR